jgi:hypothetical protein
MDEDKHNAVLQSVAELIESKNGKILVPQEVRLFVVRK